MSRWSYGDLLAQRRRQLQSSAPANAYAYSDDFLTLPATVGTPQPSAPAKAYSYADELEKRRAAIQRRNQVLADNLAEEKRGDWLASPNEVSAIATGALAGSAGMVAPLVRPVQGYAASALRQIPGMEGAATYVEDLADNVQGESAAWLEAHRRNVQEKIDAGGYDVPYTPIGAFRGFLNENLPGVTSSLTQMAALAPIGGATVGAFKGTGAAAKLTVEAAKKTAARRGLAGMTAGFSGSTWDQGYYQGRQAALSKVEAAKHGGEQAAAEAGFMLAGAALGKFVKGAGGIEEWFTSGKAPKLLSKQMLASGVGELTEENMTSITQQVSTAKNIPGAQDSANWTDENGSFWNSPMMNVIEQTTKQTALMLGMGNILQRAAQYASGTDPDDDGEGLKAVEAIAKVKEYVAKLNPTRRDFLKLPERFRVGVKNSATERQTLSESLGPAVEQAPAVPGVAQIEVADPAGEALPSERPPDELPEARVESPSPALSAPSGDIAGPLAAPPQQPPRQTGIEPSVAVPARTASDILEPAAGMVDPAPAIPPAIPEAGLEPPAGFQTSLEKRGLTKGVYGQVPTERLRVANEAIRATTREGGEREAITRQLIAEMNRDFAEPSEARRRAQARSLAREAEEQARALDPSIPEDPFPIVYTDSQGRRLKATQLGVQDDGKIKIKLDKGQRNGRNTFSVLPSALIERAADIDDMENRAASEANVPIAEIQKVYAEVEGLAVEDWSRVEAFRREAKKLTNLNAQKGRIIQNEQGGDLTNVPDLDVNARTFMTEHPGNPIEGTDDADVPAAVFAFATEPAAPQPSREDMLRTTVDRITATRGEVSDEGDVSFDPETFGAEEFEAEKSAEQQKDDAVNRALNMLPADGSITTVEAAQKYGEDERWSVDERARSVFETKEEFGAAVREAFEAQKAEPDPGKPLQSQQRKKLSEKTAEWKRNAILRRRAAAEELREAFVEGRDVFFSGPPLDPKKIGAAVKFAATIVEEGVVTFADYMAKAGDALGADAAKMRTYLEEAWRRIGQTNTDLKAPPDVVAPESVQVGVEGVEPAGVEGLPPGEVAGELGTGKRTFNFTVMSDKIDIIKTMKDRAALGGDVGREGLAALQEANRAVVRHALADLSPKSYEIDIQDVEGVWEGTTEPAVAVKVEAKSEEALKAIRSRMSALGAMFEQDEVHEVEYDVELPANIEIGGRDGFDHYQPYANIDLGRQTSWKEVEAAREKSGIRGLSFDGENILVYNVADNPKDFTEKVDILLGALDEISGIQPAVRRGSAKIRRNGGTHSAEEGVLGYADGSVLDGQQSPLATDIALRILRHTGGRLTAPAAHSLFTKADLTPEHIAKQRQIADDYEAAPDNDLANPIVQESYDALNAALVKQWDEIIEGNISVEFVPWKRTEGGKPVAKEPYPDSTAVTKDIRENRKLRILLTETKTFGPDGTEFPDHPLLQPSGIVGQVMGEDGTFSEQEVTYNDILRAVHDGIAHGLYADSFGPIGEEGAWRAHVATIANPYARWAITSETRGQNSWVNYGPQVRDAETGELILDREAEGYLPLKDRKYARQKAMLIPIKHTLTGNSTVDAPMQALIKSLSPEGQMGSLPGPVDATGTVPGPVEAVDRPPEPPEPPEPPSEPPAGMPRDDEGELITGIRSSIVDNIREARGVPERESDPTVRTREQMLEDAQERMALDPDWAPNLVESINKDPRELGTTEIAGLGLRYQSLITKMNSVNAELTAANESEDEVRQALAYQAFEQLMRDIDQTEMAAQVAGRESFGRTGQAMQIILRDDWSQGVMLNRAYGINGGKLSDEERTTIVEEAETLERLRKAHEAAVEQLSEDDQNKLIDAAMAPAAKAAKGKRKRAAKKADIQKRIDSAFDDFVKAQNRVFANPFDPKLVVPAVKLAVAHIEMGVVTFQEFMANIRSRLGNDVEEGAFRQAWDEQRESGAIDGPDPDDAAGISRLANQLLRSVVESGVTERDPAVDLVLQGLKEWMPETTLRETREALTKYGRFTPLSKGQLEVNIRDIKGQLLPMLKLEDMKAGKAPLRTGWEQPLPSDAARQLGQQVTEAKKQGGYVVTDPERQLRTALDALKRAASHRIKDLETEIRLKKRIVKDRTELQPDAELESLRKRRDALKKVRDELLREPRESTDAQRIAAREGALGRVIELLEADIEAGGTRPKAKGKEPATSPLIESRLAQIEELKAHRGELRELANPSLTPEQKKEVASIRRMNKQLSFWQEMLANEDFQKKPRKARVPMSREAIRIRKEVRDVKKRFLERQEEYRRSQFNSVEQVGDALYQAMHASRAIITSFDLSAAGRQGGFVAAARPTLALKAGKVMLGAMASKGGEFTAGERIANRPNALGGYYDRWGLALTTSEGDILKQEEAYMGRWASQIPGVDISERAYVSYLNEIRADYMDSLVATLGRSGEVTEAEGKSLARFVNVATGRGDMKFFGRDLTAASAGAATILFAPRYVKSRFDLLITEPLRLVFGKDTARVKRRIAKEYVRALAGTGTFIGMALLAGTLLMDEDDPWYPTLETDPRSTDFMKLKFGETRLDLLYGLGQATVFLTRVLGGEAKTAKGEIKSLDANIANWGEATAASEIGKFLRTKLAPFPGAAIDVLEGQNVVGDKVTKLSALAGLATPLSVRDVAPLLREQGMGRGAAMQLLGLLGGGVQTYGPRTRNDPMIVRVPGTDMKFQLGATPVERSKQFTKDIDNAAYGDEPPVYMEPGMDTRRWENVQQKKLATLVRASTTKPISHSGRAKQKKAREQLKAHSSLEEAREQLRSTYRRNWSNRSKDIYKFRHRSLRELFPDQVDKN